jgi:regulator of replication initiation timing
MTEKRDPFDELEEREIYYLDGFKKGIQFGIRIMNIDDPEKQKELFDRIKNLLSRIQYLIQESIKTKRWELEQIKDPRDISLEIMKLEFDISQSTYDVIESWIEDEEQNIEDEEDMNYDE